MITLDGPTRKSAEASIKELRNQDGVSVFYYNVDVEQILDNIGL